MKQFLDQAAREHDERVLKVTAAQKLRRLKYFQGDSSGNLFPRPVYEQPPQEQRSMMLQHRRKLVATNVSDLGLMDESDDAFNFAALCRGEEMRSRELVASLSCWLDNRDQPWLIIQVRMEDNGTLCSPCCNYYQKSRIRETPTLSTDADSSTDTIKILTLLT